VDMTQYGSKILQLPMNDFKSFEAASKMHLIWYSTHDFKTYRKVAKFSNFLFLFSKFMILNDFKCKSDHRLFWLIISWTLYLFDSDGITLTEQF